MAITADAVKERPIDFEESMVLALLGDRKTQTRRLVEPQPSKLDQSIPSMGIPCGPADWAWPYPDSPMSCRITNKRSGPSGWTEYCPFGQPGDRLWAQEPYWEDSREPLYGMNPAIIYAASPEWYKGKIDGLRRCSCLTTDHRDSGFITREQSQARLDEGLFWSRKPASRMPRWASRITLEITDVRIERLLDISEEDKLAEGATPEMPFGTVWKKLHTKPGERFEDSPWTWVISFRKVAG